MLGWAPLAVYILITIYSLPPVIAINLIPFVIQRSKSTDAAVIVFTLVAQQSMVNFYAISGSIKSTVTYSLAATLIVVNLIAISGRRAVFAALVGVYVFCLSKMICHDDNRSAIYNVIRRSTS